MKTPITNLHAVIVGCMIALISCGMSIRSISRGFSDDQTFALPVQLGAWTMVGNEELPESELEVLHATNYWRQSFKNKTNDQTVVVTFIAGPAGPLASHLPETCYARHEFASIGKAASWIVPNSEHEFRFQTLVSRDIEQPSVTLAYSWHDGSHWCSPRYPRIQLAGHANLRRLMVSVRHPRGHSGNARQIIESFIGEVTNSTLPTTRIAALQPANP
ncbi:hypothetical protein LOC67_02950 [Stieleria sp. JC731]|uniref:exosortase-associated EpsI family protein n=1 Tax=Pirellulaceae TaxID=2691357 RepID=UPI001E37FF9D|nr:exosortase-associated EpsI family protein [Stieleria sp. JC731]MCC9599504.1 hypothetical protein [Stieleria sp. JC731]